METAREKEIIVKHGMVKKLAQITGYSESTIRHSLRGYEGVSKPKRSLIRQRAIEYGGVYVG